MTTVVILSQVKESDGDGAICDLMKQYVDAKSRRDDAQLVMDDCMRRIDEIRGRY